MATNVCACMQDQFKTDCDETVQRRAAEEGWKGYSSFFYEDLSYKTCCYYPCCPSEVQLSMMFSQFGFGKNPQSNPIHENNLQAFLREVALLVNHIKMIASIALYSVVAIFLAVYIPLYYSSQYKHSVGQHREGWTLWGILTAVVVVYTAIVIALPQYFIYRMDRDIEEAVAMLPVKIAYPNVRVIYHKGYNCCCSCCGCFRNLTFTGFTIFWFDNPHPTTDMLNPVPTIAAGSSEFAATTNLLSGFKPFDAEANPAPTVIVAPAAGGF